ncbi:serine/threonine protein kinase [Aporhodopirellula aestuarii]|uniref:Protein kinase n=1 Tax=Aporhodopirellula aestuarii TaxID=2950107 RepID=A0ABT0U5I0_9BACT|nr:serine/threonine-protein kinase [Aporhodopirellula aestuarii]MCM2372111.1 protein kinase [Aporhodopirellula aestuarii]
MPDQAIHPTRAELHSYGLGQLSPDKATAIEMHIRECEPCCETIANLSSNDTFVELLQEAEQLPADQIGDHEGVPIKPSSSSEDIPVPLAEHPRYEIVGLIGRGGMGNVYEARHRKMERTVALKVINREFVRKTEAVDRFHREAKTAAQLSHPNIVTAYDADNAGDYHFMVMEYVDGVDLSRIIKDRGALPVTEACKYIRQAATGLHYAYEQGMVHRDIKPHNLMVTADGTVKILDFGLASLAPEVVSDANAGEVLGELTTAGTVMGTPDYISPEQAEDARQADVRSDIYSLGATLYHLLSGRPPFDDGSVTQKLNSHAQVEPERLESLRDDIPVELSTIVTRMMAKDPEERFQTPAEVAAALESLLQAIEPPQKPSPHQIRPVRKRRRLLLLAAVVTLFIAALVAGVMQFFQMDIGTIRGTGKVVAIGPGTSQRAVELWISGDDGLLVQEGDDVRLHFEGWPAMRSDGAFGGEVMSVDLTDDTAGIFRILIKADGKESWPDPRYLRPGVRANCWIFTRSR